KRRIIKKWSDSLDERGVGAGRKFETLLAVLNEIFDAENRQRIVIFQGDGSEIFQLKTDDDSPYQISNSAWEKLPRRYQLNKKNFGFTDIKEAIERSGATIYSVAPGIRFLGFSKEEQKARAKLRSEERRVGK